MVFLYNVIKVFFLAVLLLGKNTFAINGVFCSTVYLVQSCNTVGCMRTNYAFKDMQANH